MPKSPAYLSLLGGKQQKFESKDVEETFLGVGFLGLCHLSLEGSMVSPVWQINWRPSSLPSEFQHTHHYINLEKAHKLRKEDKR